LRAPDKAIGTLRASLEKADRSYKNEQKKRAQLTFSEKRLIKAILLSLDGEYRKAVEMLQDSTVIEDSEMTPQVIKRYLDARKDLDVLYKKREEMGGLVDQRIIRDPFYRARIALIREIPVDDLKTRDHYFDFESMASVMNTMKTVRVAFAFKKLMGMPRVVLTGQETEQEFLDKASKIISGFTRALIDQDFKTTSQAMWDLQALEQNASAFPKVQKKLNEERFKMRMHTVFRKNTPYQMIGVKPEDSREAIVNSYVEIGKKLKAQIAEGDQEAQYRFPGINFQYRIIEDPRIKKVYDEKGFQEAVFALVDLLTRKGEETDWLEDAKPLFHEIEAAQRIMKDRRLAEIYYAKGADIAIGALVLRDATREMSWPTQRRQDRAMMVEEAASSLRTDKERYATKLAGLIRQAADEEKSSSRFTPKLAELVSAWIQEEFDLNLSILESPDSSLINVGNYGVQHIRTPLSPSYKISLFGVELRDFDQSAELGEAQRIRSLIPQFQEVAREDDGYALWLLDGFPSSSAGQVIKGNSNFSVEEHERIRGVMVRWQNPEDLEEVIAELTLLAGKMDERSDYKRGLDPVLSDSDGRLMERLQAMVDNLAEAILFSSEKSRIDNMRPQEGGVSVTDETRIEQIETFMRERYRQLVGVYLSTPLRTNVYFYDPDGRIIGEERITSVDDLRGFAAKLQEHARKVNPTAPEEVVLSFSDQEYAGLQFKFSLKPSSIDHARLSGEAKTYAEETLFPNLVRVFDKGLGAENQKAVSEELISAWGRLPSGFEEFRRGVTRATSASDIVEIAEAMGLDKEKIFDIVGYRVAGVNAVDLKGEFKVTLTPDNPDNPTEYSLRIRSNDARTNFGTRDYDLALRITNPQHAKDLYEFYGSFEGIWKFFNNARGSRDESQVLQDQLRALELRDSRGWNKGDFGDVVNYREVPFRTILRQWKEGHPTMSFRELGELFEEVLTRRDLHPKGIYSIYDESDTTKPSTFTVFAEFIVQDSPVYNTPSTYERSKKESLQLVEYIKGFDVAMLTSPRRPGEDREGGIDLNPINLDLQIKRDGDGMPLPMQFQEIQNINIEGLIPVIINVTPVTSLPIFSALEEEETPQQLSLNK